MVKCRRCGVDKDETEYYKGHRICKKCRIAYVAKWKKQNPDRVKASEKKRRTERADELREYNTKYREANREAVNEASKRYRDSNREICRKRCLDHYYKNREKYAEYREENHHRRKKYDRWYRQKNREAINEQKRVQEKKYREENPLEHKARKAVYHAIKTGKLERPSKCQMCNEECKPEAHHSDYAKPLEVFWVCRTCHGAIHRQLNRTKKKHGNN